MANEILKPDGNTRNVAGAITDDANAEIRKLRIDDTTKGLKVMLVGGTGSGTLTDVTDGTTTVSNATTLDFTSGATVTDGGSGVAQVAIGSSGITIGTTTVTSGTDKGILYNNAGVVGNYTPSASLILATDASKNVQGLTTATYPSLTELSYVKGVTSALQTQLNAKQSTITFGTGVQTALGVNIGSAGAPVLFNGALGTPSSGTLTSATGLPVSTGISGLGTGVATALAVNVGSAGAFVTFNGALGTPSSGTGTNITGITAAHVVAGSFGTGAYTMDTKLTVPQVINTANTVTVTSNAGTVPVTSKINNFTNSSAATMAITMATSGAVDGQLCIVRIYDASGVAQTIGWTNTENSTVTAPTTSNGSTTLPLTVGFQFNGGTSKWRCIASA
jgi:hypothetical protein